MRLPNWRQGLERLKADANAAKAEVKRVTEVVKLRAEELANTTEALAVAQAIADDMQKRAHGRICRVVGRCLTIVFEEPYEFDIEFTHTRGKTAARMVFIRNGIVLDDPKFEISGGVLDVAAWGLRLADLMFSVPQKRPVIILDEPFKHISAVRRGRRIAAMLDTLSKEFNVQFIMVTHMPELQAGHVVEF